MRQGHDLEDERRLAEKIKKEPRLDIVVNDPSAVLDPRPLLVWERQIELQEQIGQEDGIKEAIEEKETIVLLVGRDLVV